MLTALCLALSWACLIIGAEIDNGIVGEPEVQCGADTVEMQFRSKHPFKGKVYVKGHFFNPECKVDYTVQNRTSGSRPTGGIVIRHGACDMERQRVISPQGMQFSAVVVISFHPTFITKIDKAFNVKCMYRELARTVTTNVEVSALTTQVLSYSFPMPVCTYTIRRDELDGEILRYAKVGELVVHRWECQSDVFGILVHSCVVEDGQGEKIEVVNEKGCHVDDYVLGDPTYIDALSLAYREAHVVKFADRITVRFQCQIKLCMKADGGCRGITPPICPGTNQRLARVSSHNGTTSFKSLAALEPSAGTSTPTPIPTLPTIATTSQAIFATTTTPAESSTLTNSSTSTTAATTTSSLSTASTPQPFVQFSSFNHSTPAASNSSAEEQTDDDEESDEEDEDEGEAERRRKRFRQLRRRMAVPANDLAQNVLERTDAPTVIDGDFNSQVLFVLDSTENPEKGSKNDHQSFESFLRRNGGSIVSESRSNASANDVCMSTVTFSLLMASVVLVFIAASFFATVVCCHKLCAAKRKRLSHANCKSSSQLNDGFDSFSSCYSSVASLWK